MSILSLFKKRQVLPAELLHQALVVASRRPWFYLDAGVPDTLDGRFELLSYHTAFLLRRLRGQDDALAQKIFDTLFAQMDLNFREMGVGDLGVGKRVRAMAEALYGRMMAYEAALIAPEDQALYKALCNNLYGTLIDVPQSAWTDRMIDYTARLVAHLEAIPLQTLQNGQVSFPDV